MRHPVALVVAKAPVSGRVKTRLACDVGPLAAADLAAASFLDTIDACEAVFEGCHVALDGDLRDARRGDEIASRLATWRVHSQCSGNLGRRLANAHHDVGRTAAGPVVQVGMDTPQLAESLGQVADLAVTCEAVLGRAVDGGWWVLALRDSGHARVLARLRMSSRDTHRDTLAALRWTGVDVTPTRELRDVDTVVDAELVASEAPGTRFAAAWADLR